MSDRIRFHCGESHVVWSGLLADVPEHLPAYCESCGDEIEEGDGYITASFHERLAQLQRLVRKHNPGFDPEEAAHQARCEVEDCARCDAYDNHRASRQAIALLAHPADEGAP